MLNNTIDFDSQSAADALDTLLEMKANIPAAVIQQRTSTRIEIRTGVTVRPGNSSLRDSALYEGVTGDISRGGCQILFSRPLAVGDVFWLNFDGFAVVNESVMARCVRCRFLREDAFETGFRFFEPIELRIPQ